MARGTMHAAKPDDQRRRRNKPTHDTTVYTDDGSTYGPTLEELTGRSDWSAGVLAWFEDWRHMPQARDFLRTDWRRLAMIAPLVEKMEKAPGAAAMSEIRMNEERLGATITDRMRARMAIQREDDGAGLASVSPIGEDEEDDDEILEDL